MLEPVDVETWLAALCHEASLKVLPMRSDKTDAAAIVTMDNEEQATALVANPPAGLVVKAKIVNDWSKGGGKVQCTVGRYSLYSMYSTYNQ